MRSPVGLHFAFRVATLACGVLLSLAALPARAAPAADVEKTWMQVLLDGRKIGHLVSKREVQGERVLSSERMEATIDRAGISLSMTTEETSIESLTGEPLGFRSESSLSGMATLIEGKLTADGQVDITITSGGRVDKRTMAWPKGAVLAEAARLLEAKLALREGDSYELLAFQPSSMIAVPVKVRVGPEERVQLGLKREKLRRMDQRVELPGAPLETQAWVTKDHDLRKAVLPMLGLNLEMIACSEACAKAPNQSSDILNRTMVAAPRALVPGELEDGIQFALALSGSEETALPDAAEQRAVRGKDRAWTLSIDPGAGWDTRAPVDADRRATRWLESDSKEVADLAKSAVAKADTAAAQMHALEDFVRGYIKDKTLRVGYASARETVQQREGDCTEHALLLAAMGRAVAIPTRVVNGLAYAPHYVGRDHVFVPHAWVQAWVGDHWQSFDAALPGFDAGHIALSFGDGDPSGFYAGVNLLGNVRIESVRALDRQP